jgi:anti-sigma factor RsiW
MDCDGIMERLDDLLAGVLSAADRDAVERHLRDCPHCRELTALVSGDLGRLSDEAPGGLAEAILRRTSGSPCESARGRLCGYVDGESEPVDRELVRLHLDGCGDCAAMVGALARLAEDLPALARVEPDDRFVSELLGRTTGRLRRVERWAARLAAGWGEMLRRPRFAWEAAYVATFVVALAFTTPGSPLAGVPRTALELAETRPVAELREPVARLESRVSEENARFWRVAHERTTQTLGQTAKGAGRVSRSLGEKIRVGLGTLSERLASMQETEDNDRSSDSDDRRQGEER